MTEQYGPPIPLNGVRPDWLRDDDEYERISHGLPPAWDYQTTVPWHWFATILVRASHPASICQQRALDHPDERPWTPIHADGTVPVDYDGGDVLLRSGRLGRGERWTIEGRDSDIVGYRRKATTAGPTSQCDKCGEFYPSAPIGTVHKCGKCSGGICHPTTAGPMPTCAPELPTYDPATHALVERMTRGDWTSMHSTTLSGHGSFAWADHVGIIKPDPDPIVEYATKHGLDVDELRALVKGAAA